jgi:transposase
MVHANRLSRGDVRRNARLDRLRRVVSADRAVLAVDLADDKQVLVLTDHDSKVLARRTVRCRPWALDQALRWGLATARASGFASVVVACEPTGHRWRVVAEHAAGLGVELVCVQPMLVRRAREAEDFTRDKSDNKDALLIARLATQLHCYLPERPTMAWARLRHLGARRVEQTTRATAAQQRLRDLLECAWPAALAPAVAAWPLDSLTWRAAMTVGRCDPARIRALGWTRFARAVDRELPRWGSQRRCARILRAVWIAANSDSGGGVTAQRPGALERAAFVLADFHHALGELAEVEARMAAVLAELGLGELVATIPGVSAVGAAAILAETGDPTRFDSPRAVVKHAGLCPRDNASGAFAGKTMISGRGRPLLRLAAWRASWGALPHNPVLAARYAHLTTRERNPLTDGQARTAVAAALLRQLWVVCVTRVPWDPAVAGGAVAKEVTDPAA